MKKLLLIPLLAFCLFSFTSLISAQRGQQGQGEQQVDTESRGIGAATQNLNRIVDRKNNPEIGEQVRTMIQAHEKVQTRTQTALQEMSQRKEAVKLMIGPDYKNAGQVRSDVVGLRNDIKKLEQIKEDSLPSDTEDVQGAIDELKVETNNLEIQLAEELSGFSFFGWLNRLINR
jgi:hypothetical protein